MSRERGAVAVEFAAVLPLAAVAMLAVAQVGLLVASQLVVVHAAREGARAAAIHNDDDRGRDAALAAGNLDPDRTEVSVWPGGRRAGDPVTVHVSTRVPVMIPLVQRFVPDGIRLEAAVTMRTERDEPG